METSNHHDFEFFRQYQRFFCSFRKIVAAGLLLCLTAANFGCLNISRGDKNLDQLKAHLNQGNAAFHAKRYDEAVEQYDRGLAIAPQEPVFLANKSSALRLRGVGAYNAAIKSGDARVVAAGKERAGQDFYAAAALSTAAVNRFKASPILPLLELVPVETGRLTAFEARAEALRLLVSIADKTRADEALAAIHEYVDLEPDQAKKIRAMLGAGKMLTEAKRGDAGAVEYKNVLKVEPNNVDALVGVGLALAQSGDAAKLREAEPYLQRFVAAAPDSHSLKASVKETLDLMKQDAAAR